MSKKKKEKKTTDISYAGEITVKILHGKKVVKSKKLHNNGTNLLFNYIARCLSGTYEEAYAPRYLRTFYTTSEITDLYSFVNNIDTTNVVSDCIPYGTVVISDDAVEFQFLIPSNVLNSNTINVLGMYSKDTLPLNDTNVDNPMAYVVLGSGDEIDIQTGENALVLWKMTLANKVETE